MRIKSYSDPYKQISQSRFLCWCVISLEVQNLDVKFFNFYEGNECIEGRGRKIAQKSIKVVDRFQRRCIRNIFTALNNFAYFRINSRFRILFSSFCSEFISSSCAEEERNFVQNFGILQMSFWFPDDVWSCLTAQVVVKAIMKFQPSCENIWWKTIHWI